MNERAAINAVALAEFPGECIVRSLQLLFLGNERLQVNDHRSMYFEHPDDPGFTFDRALFAQPFLISSYHENLLNRRLRLHRRLSRS